MSTAESGTPTIQVSSDDNGDAGPDVSNGDLSLLGALADSAGRLVTGAEKLDAQCYDGHVALALDPALLSDMDSTLDALTTSLDLFDVPVLDIAGLDDAIAT